MLRKGKKTTILLTGASGFIGKYLLDILKEKFDVIAMSRRSGIQAGVPFHPNIRWPGLSVMALIRNAVS